MFPFNQEKKSFQCTENKAPLGNFCVSSHCHFAPSNNHCVEKGPASKGTSMACTCPLNIINTSDALQPGLGAESVILFLLLEKREVEGTPYHSLQLPEGGL